MEADEKCTYRSPLSDRYASKEMQVLFSERHRILSWRQLWIWLAEAQLELGLAVVRQEQIDDMKEQIDQIDWNSVGDLEKRMRHDVMAHLHAFEQVAVKAKGIIHLGATSAFVTDNADLINFRSAIDIILQRLRLCLYRMAHLAMASKGTATVGRTHYQPASLTTVGKRFCMWAQDLLIAHDSVQFARDALRFRGAKGATGTQSSFLLLFNGDADKVAAMDAKISAKAGFGTERQPRNLTITGQTYSRLQDCQILSALAMVGAAVHRIAMDMRLLQTFGELVEPFESSQVGSSAMPYKRNPMRCERCCGLARFLMNLAPNALQTAAAHGFERTLDDSSVRRVAMPEAFLCADALLLTFQNVLEGLQLKPACIAEHVKRELPFLTLEGVLMRMTLTGAGRQETHEKIRQIALKARQQLDDGAQQVNLKIMLQADPFFQPIWAELDSLLSDDSQIGLCVSQVETFVKQQLGSVISTLDADSKLQSSNLVV